jgi:plasmid stabilization system protein ParE
VSFDGKRQLNSRRNAGVPKGRSSYKIVLAIAARRDIINILKRSKSEFGIDAAERYESLILQALRDIEIDPERPGSKERPELGKSARTYHLQFSRERAICSLPPYR